MINIQLVITLNIVMMRIMGVYIGVCNGSQLNMYVLISNLQNNLGSTTK